MSGTRGGLGRIVAMGIGAGGGAAAAGGRRGAGRQVRGRPVRLVRRRRRRLGRHHRRRQVPPRRLLRAAGRRRPLRRRPPEELHPRRPGHRLRHPLRPLALDGAAGDRDHPGPRHLVARPPRRDRAAGRRRSTGAAASTPSSRRRPPTSPRATSSPASRPAHAAIEDRLLCARAESKWCSLDPGSWSGMRALTITVEDDTGARRRDHRRRSHRRRLAPRQPGRLPSPATTPAPASASAKPCSTAPASASPSTPAQRSRSAASGAATRMQPCLTGVSGRHDDRHHQLQRRPAHARPLRRPTSPATPAAPRRSRS